MPAVGVHRQAGNGEEPGLRSSDLLLAESLHGDKTAHVKRQILKIKTSVSDSVPFF